MKGYSLLRFPDFKYKAVTLSYDDDTVHNKKIVEILDEYGLKCTFNLNSGRFAAEEDNGETMTESQAVELFKNGKHEIAVHGKKHLSLAEFDSAVCADEIAGDRKNLENLFGRIIKGMAYACGSFNDEVVEILKACGINYARTIESTGKFDIPSDWLRLPATCHHDDERLQSLADEFLKDYPENLHYVHKKPKLFYLWGHAFEFAHHDNWYIIENFAKKVGNRDDVWYATNGEVYDYVKAFDSLEFSVNGEYIKNPSAICVYLNYCGQDVKVPAGATVKTKFLVV